MTPFAIPAAAEDLAQSQISGMDEESFRTLYDRTAHPLRIYLIRMLNDASQADDILQETYLRFLRAKLPESMGDEHRKNYLFRIATNLARTEMTRRRTVPLTESQPSELLGDDVSRRRDIHQVLGNLKPRQRELLWLAYVERFTHEEIAAIMGAKAHSIRPMLARARQKFAEMLRHAGFETPSEKKQ